jgi:hypothetical protein
MPETVQQLMEASETPGQEADALQSLAGMVLEGLACCVVSWSWRRIVLQQSYLG